MPAISGMNATPGKPGAPICLGNHATVYHFQRHFLEVKSCLFRPFFTSFYATLRLFTPLLRIFPPLLHMWFQQSSSFWTQLPFFGLTLESGMENCHFPKVAFKKGTLWHSRLFRPRKTKFAGRNISWYIKSVMWCFHNLTLFGLVIWNKSAARS